MNQPLPVLAFKILVIAHICVGSVGLASFWPPMFSRKGDQAHRRWGRIFTYCMLITGALAIGISLCTLIVPLETHPKIPDEQLVRGIFGWMMQYLGILTINLAWYGLQCVRNRRNHLANREWRNLLLQAAVLIAATNVAVRGILIGQPLMIGITFIGFATGITNLFFLFKPRLYPNDWKKEHLKGLVGAAISVYTAFFAFGAVRLIPELALNPFYWAIPLVVGLAIILYHWREIGRRSSGRATRVAA